MSVLINRMDIPKSCSDCPLNYDEISCVVTGTRWRSDTMILLGFDYTKERLHDCPISEVPSAQPNSSHEIQEILNYLDTTLHPIVSPDNWYVYAELHDMVSRLPSTQSDGADINVGSMISRQAAIGTIKRMKDVCDTDDINDYYNLLIEAFNVLPSAQPDAVTASLEELINDYGEDGFFIVDGVNYQANELLNELKTNSSVGEKFRKQITKTIVQYFMKFGDGKCPLVEAPESCDDAVSRKAVYVVIEEVLYETTKGADNWYGLLNDGVRTLPSVTPKRKTGRWVNNIHDLPVCDQCGYMTPYDRAIDDYEYGNYCPNCGAKMDGGECDGCEL